jgi:hypothetical protein
MLRRFAIALTVIAVSALACHAQVRPGFGISSAPTRNSGFHGRAGMQRAERAPLFLGAPYLYPDDFSSVVETPAPAPPQIVILQGPPAVEPPKEPKPQALLIEWQGDRYVRIGSSEQAQESHTSVDHAATMQAAPPIGQSANLPPAVLVYRDGRREEVRDYTIVDGALYAAGDYWVDGYWNKKIQLSALDVPATVKASMEQGVKFTLPTSPNEVIVRP